MKDLAIRLLVLIGCTLQGSAQTLPVLQSNWKELSQLNGMRQAQMGIAIINLTTGQTLWQSNGEKCFIPASAQKLLIAATALSTPGIAPNFLTRLGYTGKLNGDILEGDLVVIGNGDPTLGMDWAGTDRALEQWAQQVFGLGIRQISGNVIAYAGNWSSDENGKQWLYEDVGNYYGAGPSGLCWKENCYELTLTSSSPGSLCQVLWTFPAIPGLVHHSSVMAKGTQDQAYILGGFEQWDRKVVGTLPAHKGQYVIKGAVPDPALLIAQQLAEILQKKGIKLIGKPMRQYGANPSFVKDIDTVYSPSLKKICRRMLWESQNLFAENLLLHVSKSQNNVSGGLQAIKQWAKTVGIDTFQLRLADASGLSPLNAISPVALALAARAWYKLDKTEGLREQVPGAYTKSGYINGVRSYAGVKGNYAFAVMVNFFQVSPSEMRKQIEKIILTIPAQ
jgi:D-alanyl-D-alanine carboxypeptidase/D-alanyl-D-alanine-endopeptidase (penicillin-binding protein 4)